MSVVSSVGNAAVLSMSFLSNGEARLADSLRNYHFIIYQLPNKATVDDLFFPKYSSRDLRKRVSSYVCIREGFRAKMYLTRAPVSTSAYPVDVWPFSRARF